MGGASCCGPKVEYLGSVFYQKIDVKMEKTGKPELDEVFAKMDDPLQKSEETRALIANAFKEMTTITGTCVLKIPDLEQCVRAFLIRFLMEVRMNAPTTGDSVAPLDITKLDLQTLFSFSQESPYLSFDEEKLKNLQSLVKCDPNTGELGKMKETIVNFLHTLEGIKSVFDEYSKECAEIKDEAMEFVNKLKMSDGMSSIYNDIMVAKRNVQKILDMRSIINVFGEVAKEIAEVVEVFGKLYADKSSFNVFDNLAKEMVEKNVTEMKLMVWNTTNEAKLDKFEFWETNFDYVVVGQLKTSA
jgi:hypothetical protein